MSVRSNRRKKHTKILLKYCLYAWGGPGALVLICVILDMSKVANIGYGENVYFCDHRLATSTQTSKVHCRSQRHQTQVVWKIGKLFLNLLYNLYL